MSSEVGLLPSLIQKHHPTRGAGVILRRLCCLGVAVALAVLISPGVRSELASRQEMDNVARNWLTETVSRTGHWAGTGDPVITGSREIQLDGTAIGRCYDVSPRGFVLVPALRSLNPVKAYSDESSLSLDDTGGLAKLLTDVLIGYSTTFRDAFGRLSAVPPAGMAGDDQILRQRWHSLGVDPREYTGSAAAQGLSQGGPLLTSSWHQRAPYDYFCPMGDGQRTAAGCVPISLAQILRYWEWPPSGTGDKTYLWPGDYSCGGSTSETELWADFSDPYDWTNMPDSCDDANGCSPAEEAAVAELCFEAGMALGTNYGACGSSAPANFAVLPETFRYATSLKSRLRTDHTRQEWFDRVQLEVNAGRPAWYIVYAHAVVCDGWREQPDGQLEYHMNYGWGQAANAWYVLDTLYCSWMPGDLCPYEYEWMVTGIEPGVAPELECTGYALDDASGNGNGCAEKGEQVGLTITIRNYGEEALNVTGSISTDDIWLSINTPSALFGPSTTHWGTSTAQTPMEIEIAPNCPDPHVALLELTLSADGGYTHLDSLFLFVGEQTGFADDLEGGFQYWSHHSARPFFGNQWHLETYRSHSGASSWKAGGSGASGYDNNLGADLLTPPFLLPPDGQLSFWHWIDSEIEDDTLGYDGGAVFISALDGSWEQLAPSGGYPYRSFWSYPNVALDSGGPGFFAGTNDWEEVRFDLSAYQGVVQLMFRFCSDKSVTQEGWYIDDVAVATATCCQDRVGDANGQAGDEPTISDISVLIDAKFISGTCDGVVACLAEGDINQSGGTNPTCDDITISDISILIDYLFITGQTLGLPDCL